MGETLDFLLLKVCGALDRMSRGSAPGAALAGASGDDVYGTGSVIAGRYQVVEKLGEGAFGRVWKVKDQTGDKVVALKELIARAGDAEAQQQAQESILQLEQEFFSLSKLQHPNIVRMFDYGTLSEGARYVVMELVPGQDLYDRLKAGPLPRAEAARALIGLMQALHLLHSRLYVHCDIKAENVRLTDRGEVKLMDFGLLHQLGTPSTQVRGTPHYMAPEVVKGGVIDARTDLYSVGALAYELFTGSLPFDGESAAEIIGQHLRDKPREPSYFLDLPPEIDAFVLRLLEKEPRNRYQNAAEALTDLARISGISLELAPVSHRTSYLYSADLIGRGAESQALDDLRQALGKGQGGSVFICGRGGEGKTRLLEEFRLRVKLDKIPWASGQCRKEGLRPLQPMADALSILLSRTPEEQMSTQGSHLALLFPELAARGFKPPQFADAAQAKLALHESVSRWLAGLAELSPLAVCLEDLHLADGATLELLNFLVRARGETPVLYVATFRSNEVDRTSVVYATADEKLTRLLELAPLKRGDVSDLLGSTLRDFELSDRFVGDLFQTTQGNAFFVVETLRYLVESGTLGQAKGVWQMPVESVELPPHMDELVSRRLGFLSQELLDFCRTLAPIGRALDIKLAQA
ncbi:MAG: protein kinase, partial [Deltaproteobacteria bacterium]|nr:protein kinase [Deltaproteobacteria bacterium]